MSILKRAWLSLRYRVGVLRLKYRICGLGRVTNKKAILVGIPNHSNIGDMAIGEAEKAFLRSCNVSFASLTVDECNANLAMLKRVVGPDTLICYHGGGNLGNLYMFEEEHRRTMLREFPDNPSLIFPQTVYFTPDGNGKAERDKVVSVYGSHRRLTVALRDEGSYELAKELFPHANVIFCPDIVMSTCKRTFGVGKNKRSGALLCFRNDIEKSFPSSDMDKLVSRLNELGIGFGYTDTVASQGVVAQKELYGFVSGKIKELSSASLVITDRLHGMVFSAIAETPCIAFGNFNHKVEQSYKMLCHLDYVRFVRSADEAVALIEELYGKACFFDREPILPRYDGLKRVILEYTKK